MKHSRDALNSRRLSSRMLRDIFDENPTALFVLDQGGRIIEANPSGLSALGAADADAVSGLDLFTVLDPPPSPSRRQALRRGERLDLTSSPAFAGLTERPVFRWSVTPLSTGLLLAEGRDITEQSRAERSLREAEWMQSIVLNATAEMFAYYDLDLKVQWANRASAESVGMSIDELLGRHCYEIWHGRDSACDGCPVQRALETDRPQEGEVTSPDGRTWFLRGYPVLDDHGAVVGLCEFGRDITGRKRTEERLKASLREKEVLLQEIHHRVKNNMQIISSLLRIQARKAGDRVDRDVLRSLERRVRAMALIHEKVYRTGDLGRIDLGLYLHDLVNDVMRSYASETSHVDISVNADPVAIGLDQAIPCALIITELVSNALLHAFPEDRRRREKRGEIAIRAWQTPDGMIRIAVEDDGAGLPEGITLERPETVGLRLVRNLVFAQLKGRILPEPGGGPEGTRIVIEFPLSSA